MVEMGLKMTNEPRTDETKVEMCGCGKNPATKELHSCPYQADVNNDDRECCKCCSDCAYECAMCI